MVAADMAVDSHTDVAAAAEALATGDPVCIHDFDDREGEVDLVYHARTITPEKVARLRTDAGGLVCVALSDAVMEAAGLPFAVDAIDHQAVDGSELAYGDRPSFSLSVNHRETYTGVTDADRATTIAALGEYAAAVESETQPAFAEQFRIPGHVQLLRGAPGLLATRRGHTELGLALAEAAGVAPAVVVAEMLADGDGSRSVEAATEYAATRGIPMVDGSDLLAALG